VRHVDIRGDWLVLIVLGSDVANLEEPSTRSERERHGVDPRAKDDRIDGEYLSHVQ
jgi:hypothetical protein